MCLLCLWAGLTCLWMPDWPVHLAGLFIFLCLYGVEIDDRVFPWMLFGVCTMALFIGDGGIGNPNFISELIAILLPWACKKGYWKWLIPFALFTLFMADSRTGWLAIWVAGSFWIFKRDRMLGLILFMIPVNLAVFGVVDVGDSIRARAELWFNTVFMWVDHPIFGVGLGGFNYYYPAYDSFHLPYLGDYYHPITQYAGTAHNEYLQILTETGLIGFGLFIWFLRGLKWEGRQAWSVGIGLFLALYGFPFQNPSTLAVLALCMGKMGPREQSIPKFVPILPVLVFVAFTARTLQAEWEFQKVIVYHRLAPQSAIQANIRAYKIAPWDFRIRYQLYPMLVKASGVQGVNIPEETWRRAWEISTSASPYSRYLRELHAARQKR